MDFLFYKYQASCQFHFLLLFSVTDISNTYNIVLIKKSISNLNILLSLSPKLIFFKNESNSSLASFHFDIIVENNKSGLDNFVPPLFILTNISNISSKSLFLSIE